MFQVIRKHLSYANVAATLALVFAVTGGAFAATGHGGGASAGGSPASTATGGAAGGRTSNRGALAVASAAKSKGKTGPRGPKGPAGKTGATGATGPAGATGATGPAGPAGGTGPAGAGGESVSSTELKSGGVGGCPEGGTKFTVGGKETFACNGKPGAEGNEGPAGAIHPGETLPAGASETGAWSIVVPPTESKVPTTVSFTIPLEASLSEEHVFFLKQEEIEVDHTAECPGNAAEPKAAAGDFCAYAAELSYTLAPIQGFPVKNVATGLAGAGTSGADIFFSPNHGEPSEQVEYGTGTWAVTAP
jgi:Collagen triple helix repeat (20 copies)